MKKIILIVLLLIVLVAGIGAWIFLGPSTAFDGKRAYFYIPSSGATKQSILDSIRKHKIVSNEWAFEFTANRLSYWNRIRPGRYEIEKGMNVLNIVRKLRNGQQTPVNLVITKVRTKEDLARMVGNRFECDSSDMIRFLNNPDSLKPFNNQPETAMWMILPDTYTYFWNTTPSKIYRKLAGESEKFWTAERKQKAASLGLSPLQAYIIASIVEEETNYQEEKDTIASVYINRYRKGMALGADPTIKFALKDFSITWIHGAHLDVASPYNTYRNAGLPPGPICTPSKKTIDAVLDAPPTNYLFFVASYAFNGSHLFSNTYEEHLVKARAYQQEDRRRREAREKQNTAP